MTATDERLRKLMSEPAKEHMDRLVRDWDSRPVTIPWATLDDETQGMILSGYLFGIVHAMQAQAERESEPTP